MKFCAFTLHLMLILFQFQSINDKFVKDLAVQTSGFMPRDILALVADAGISFAHKVETDKNNSEGDKLKGILPTSSSSSQNEEKTFCKEYILSSLERAKKRNRAALGTPKVRHFNVLFFDILYSSSSQTH